MIPSSCSVAVQRGGLSGSPNLHDCVGLPSGFGSMLPLSATTLPVRSQDWAKGRRRRLDLSRGRGCRPIRSQSNPPHLREWSEPSGSSLGAQARCFAVRRFALAMTGSSHRKMARQESPAVQSFSDQGVVDRLPSSPPSQEVVGEPWTDWQLAAQSTI